MKPLVRLPGWPALARGLGVCLGLVLASQTLVAREQETFQVSLTIPSQTFYVRPADPGLLIREQVMQWDPVQRVLKPFSSNLDVRNQSGAITAHLVDTSFLSSGPDRIDLTASFNGRPLTRIGTVVVDAREARAGTRLALLIQPVVPPDGYKAGTYYGNLRVVFDASME